MTASETGPPAGPDMASRGAALKSLEDLASRLSQAGEGEEGRLIREAAASLREELARRDGELAELRRQLATTRAYIGILS